MNLQQINERLDLFPEYLKEKVNNHEPIIFDSFWLKPRRWGVSELYRTFKEQGFLMYDRTESKPSTTFISFDDWLWQKQRYDLCDLEEVTCLKSPYDELVSKPENFSTEIFLNKWWTMVKPKKHGIYEGDRFIGYPSWAAPGFSEKPDWWNK